MNCKFGFYIGKHKVSISNHIEHIYAGKHSIKCHFFKCFYKKFILLFVKLVNLMD